MVEFYWIGGQQLDLLSNSSPQFDANEFPSFAEKELTCWESNIHWSLKQCGHLDKPLVPWDLIAALLAFKQTALKFVERILLKWLSFSYMVSDVDLSVEKILPHVSRSLSRVNSRQLHLLNIICRRVMLPGMKADQRNNKLENLGGLCDAEREQLTMWAEVLFSSERELRERLVGFSFSTFITLASHLASTASRPGYWCPVGLAQMEQWVALNREHVRDKLKVLASEVGRHEGRYRLFLSYMLRISSPKLCDDFPLFIVSSTTKNYAGHLIICFSSKQQTSTQRRFSSREM